MTPAGLRLLLDERVARLDAAEGKARPGVPDASAGQPYASPMEFAALAAMPTK